MRFVLALGCGLLALAGPLADAQVADAGQSASATNPWVIGSAGTFALVDQYGYPYLVDADAVNDGTHRYGLALGGLLSGEF